MKKVKFILALIFCFPLLNVGYSQVSQNFKLLDMKNKLLTESSPQETENTTINPSLIGKTAEKSPYLGAIFSGLLPGAGEFYSKHYLKAGIFFAIEAGLWIAYSTFQKKGNDQTDKFQNFANSNWSVNKYAQWLVDQQFPGYGAITDPQTTNLNELRRQLNIVEAQNFSHQLPPYGEQQYYELIGKYQNFVPGWADADLSFVNRNNYNTYKTTMFINYSFDRQKANDYFNQGSTALTVIIFNHILSAADGAWSVTMFNKDLKIKTGMHLENKYSYFGEKKLIPVANVSVTF